MFQSTYVNATAIDFSSVNNNFTNGSWSLGFEFSTNTDIIVTSLGFYDDFKNGLTEAHDIGIYDNTGTLLVSSTVDNTSSLDGWFRWVSISDTFLGAGSNYFIAAVTGSENYTWDPNGFIVDPNINFIADAYIQSTILTMPNNSNNVRGIFGANFDYKTVAPVPEPATLLLFGFSILGIAGVSRRKLGK